MPVWQARQLSFDTAKLIADKGGVIGLWPMRSDVGATPEAYAQRLWELAEWLGDDHAGFGTDMNAISRPAIASYADLQKVVRYWQKAGYRCGEHPEARHRQLRPRPEASHGGRVRLAYRPRSLSSSALRRPSDDGIVTLVGTERSGRMGPRPTS